MMMNSKVTGHLHIVLLSTIIFDYGHVITNWDISAIYLVLYISFIYWCFTGWGY